MGYLHNIPTYIKEETILQELSQIYKVKEVKRKKYRDTLKPMPVVQVVFQDSNEAKEAFISKGYCQVQLSTRHSNRRGKQK